MRATLVKGLALTPVKVSVAVSASGNPVGAILSVTNPVALAWFWGHFRSVGGGDGHWVGYGRARAKEARTLKRGLGREHIVDSFSDWNGLALSTVALVLPISNMVPILIVQNSTKLSCDFAARRILSSCQDSDRSRWLSHARRIRHVSIARA